MNKYRILHIVSNPFFLNRGGLVRNLEQVKGSINSGHVLLVCSYSGGEDIEGIKIQRIPWIFWYKNISGGVHDLHRLYMDFSLLIYSFYIMCRFHPEVIHTHGLTGIVSARFYTIFYSKTIIIQDSEGTYADEMYSSEKFKTLKFIIKKIEKLIYSFTDGIVVCSNELPRILREEYKYSKPIEFVPEGMSPKENSFIINKKSIGIEGNEIVIGFVGQFHVHQRMDIMLRVFNQVAEKHDNIKFLIVGYPVDRLLKKYPIRESYRNKFIFTGIVPFSKIQGYLLAMDIGVSTKTFESYPGNGKLMDYIAAELPTVLFEHNVNRHYLGDDGVYATLGDEKDFTEKLELLIIDTNYRRQIKNRMHQRNLKFDWNGSINLLLNFYKTVLELKSIT
jgi:phosphatidylinositol alpha 1,6-mannosyltransferase